MHVLSPIYPRCAAAVARSSEEYEQLRADVGAEASASYPIPPFNKTGTGPVTKTALYFEVDHLDTITVSPPWVNVSLEGIRGGSRDPSLLPLDPTERDADDSTSPGTPSSELLGLLYPKAVKAKAAASLSSDGNFIVTKIER